jgi:hypothetical protein
MEGSALLMHIQYRRIIKLKVRMEVLPYLPMQLSCSSRSEFLLLLIKSIIFRESFS